MKFRYVELNENFLNNKIAHRGLHSNSVCENSMKAFKLAKKYGYPIELDIHRIASGEFVVFHDKNLKRVTGHDAEIEKLTLDELKDVKLWDGQSIPTLNDVLKEIDGSVPILIELKPEDGFEKNGIEPLLKILDEYNHDDKIALQSFNPLIIRKVKMQTSKYSVGLLSSHDLGKISKVKNYIARSLLLFEYSKADFVSYDIRFSPNKYVSRLQKRNKKVLTWVVNDENKLDIASKVADNIIFEEFNMEK